MTKDVASTLRRVFASEAWRLIIHNEEFSTAVSLGKFLGRDWNLVNSLYVDQVGTTRSISLCLRKLRAWVFLCNVRAHAYAILEPAHKSSGRFTHANATQS